MDFSEALQKLKDGLKVRRPAWNTAVHIGAYPNGAGGFIEGPTLYQVTADYTYHSYYAPSQADLFADDWVQHYG